MKYLHTMVRVKDVDASLDFYCNQLGLVELQRRDSEQGRFTLIFLAAPGDEDAQVELTHNWDPEEYDEGRNFGHLAYQVDDIYAAWRSCVRRIIFRSNYCKKVMPCRPRNPGHRCPASVTGSQAAGGMSGGSGSSATAASLWVTNVTLRRASASALPSQLPPSLL
jgi:catechol 2,3-dioxygenase-like lactoylglutathione lyase family enzyme